MINILIPTRFIIRNPIRTVHMEVAKRLDPKVFRVYVYFIEEKIYPEHIKLIEKTHHLHEGSIFKRAINILPKLLSVPNGIVHTVAEPKFLFVRYIRKIKDFKGKYIITMHVLDYLKLFTSGI